MSDKGSFKISTGASSILMIFVVLCLTTFAVLSYVTSNADYRLTEKANENIKKYYVADAEAQNIIYNIDSRLKELKECGEAALENNFSKMDEFNFTDVVKSEITDILDQDALTVEVKLDSVYNILVTNYTFDTGDTPADISSSSELNPVISFEIKVSDTHKLSVSLEIRPLSADQERLYKIIKYQNVSTVEAPEETPNLWPGFGVAKE